VNSTNRRGTKPARSANAAEVSGVLETIASGISMAIARPWLVVVPLLADLIVWLGIQVSGMPLITGMQSLMIEQGGPSGPTAAEELGRIGDNFRVNNVLSNLTPSMMSGLPNDSFLNIVISTLVPAATSGVDRSNMYGSWGNGLGRLVEPANGWAVIGWSLLFFTGATLLLAAFKAPIAQSVRGDDFGFTSLMRDVVMGWVRILALIGVVIVAAAVLLIPFFAMAIVVALFGINLAALISLALFVFGSVGALYVYFLLDAMFVYRAGPIRAARMSFSVARFNFTDSWRFAATSILIAGGVIQIWNVLIGNPPGIVISLLANALLGTGLSIASMMFFHDRARLPRPVLPTRSFDPLRRF
jgi:hypothetical protein